MKLPDGGSFQVYEQPFPPHSLLVEMPKPLVCRCIASNLVIEMTLLKKTHLAKAADYVGKTIDTTFVQTGNLPSHPFDMHLLLAFLAHHNRLPTKTEKERLQYIASREPVIPSDEWLASPALRRMVKEAIADLSDETIHLPTGSWNLARSLFALGDGLWKLQGDQALFWGTISSLPDQFIASSGQRELFVHLAVLAYTPAFIKNLPLRSAPDAIPDEIWIDWISLASGPEVPSSSLRAQGLGAHGTTPIEVGVDAALFALPFEHAQVLEEIADHILSTVERPVPRYLDRLLRLSVPRPLAAHVSKWDIASFLVQVKSTGLYIDVLDKTGRSMTATWWKAAKESARRVPLSFPPAAWSLLHPIFCALWVDLCSETVIVERDAEMPPPNQGAFSAQRKHKDPRSPAPIVLPPTRVVSARWTEENDIEMIEKTLREWYGYRRLPAGWHERKDRPDFLRRQQKAAQRAALHHLAAPPAGFTFVSPQGASVPARSLHQLPQVKRVYAHGLYSVALGLQEKIQELSREEAQRDGEDVADR